MAMGKQGATALERLSWRLLWVPGSDLHESGVTAHVAMLAYVMYAHEPVGNVIVLGWDERGLPVVFPWLWDDTHEEDEPAQDFEHQDDASAHVVSIVRGEDPEPLVTEVRRLRHLPKDTLRRELALRHGWACHICGKPIPPRYRAEAFYDGVRPDRMFPDIEHIIPHRLGGIHWWSNLRLAHHTCNLRKRALDLTASRDIDATLKTIDRFAPLSVKARREIRERFLREP